jgi:hypothetical protein
MSRKWLFACLLWITLIGAFLLQARPGFAQDPLPENDANCIACHEHQYYVYDAGKWFCLCEAPMHCIYCHGGRTDSSDKNVAHEGLVLHPTRNQAERCQSCHAGDYLARTVTFASIAGISPTRAPVATATPAEAVAVNPGGQAPQPWLATRQFSPWQAAGLAGLTIAFIALVFLAYRCWKADCMSNI